MARAPPSSASRNRPSAIPGWHARSCSAATACRTTACGTRHNFSLLGPAGFRREIGAAQDRLAQATGQRPTCFRAPAGLRNPFLDPVLHTLGLQLVSWTRRGFDTRESDPRTVLGRLTRDLAAGDILLLHDRHGAAMADGRPVVLAALPALLQRIRDAGLATTTVPEALHSPA